MRVCIVVNSLIMGGAERAGLLLAAGLTERAYTVNLVTVVSADSDFYEVPAYLNRIALNLEHAAMNRWQSLVNVFRRILVLRRVIKRLDPQIVIATIDRINIISIISLIGIPCRLILIEQNITIRGPRNIQWLTRILYGRADLVVSISNDVDQYFGWMSPQKRMVIHNPVTALGSSQDETVELPAEKSNIVAMGRLVYQKNFQLLLNAFALVATDFPNWHLTILGEGEERSALEQLITHLNLVDRVSLPGALKNPFPTLLDADLFVMTSRFEGFGMALAEAMVCGLPSISTDAAGGPREIIQSGVNGLLVPNNDIEALAAAMVALMRDPNLRKQMSARAVEVGARFGQQIYIDRWEVALQRVMGKET